MEYIEEYSFIKIGYYMIHSTTKITVFQEDNWSDWIRQNPI